MNDLSKHIEQFILDSNRDFNNNQIQSAIAKAEKAYSLSKNYEQCPEITRKKIEFNLATLYCCSDNIEEKFKSKAYLDLVNKSTVTFLRKKELGILYSKLGNDFKYDYKIETRIECYKSAAELLAKSKEWEQFCRVELVHAQLYNDLKMFNESLLIANKIKTACLYLTDTKTLVKIFCDLSTIYAGDSTNETKIKNAKRLLKLALNLIKNEQTEPEIQVFIYQNLAAVNNQLKNFKRSIENINNAYNLLSINHLTNSEYYVLSDLKYNEGYANAKLKKYDNAIVSFTQSHNFAKKTKQNNIWQSFEELGQLYKIIKNYQKSYFCYDQSLKYLHENKKNKINNYTELANRLNAKKNIILKLLKQTNQTIVSSDELNSPEPELEDNQPTELLKNSETIQEKHLPIETEPELQTSNESLQQIERPSRLDLKSSPTEDPEPMNLSNISNSPLNETNETDTYINSSTNKTIEFNDDTNNNDILNTIQSLNTEKQMLEKYKEVLNQPDEPEISNSKIDKLEAESTILDDTKESFKSNSFTIYKKSESLNSTYKGGSKSYESFNNGSLVNHPEVMKKDIKKSKQEAESLNRGCSKSYESFNNGSLVNHPEVMKKDIKKSKQEAEREPSKICIIS